MRSTKLVVGSGTIAPLRNHRIRYVSVGSSIIEACKPVVVDCPCEADAAAMCDLAASTGILEANSCYCYLLLCRDFADTCVVARRDDQVVGFITAYRPPQRLDTIFVWQIGVAEQFRRQGLAKHMLRKLLLLPTTRHVQFLEATIAPSNLASRRMFESFARELKTRCHYCRGFTQEMFGGEDHEEEQLFRMGPWLEHNIR